MGIRKRMPVKLRANNLRYKTSDWCKRNKDTPFDTPLLAKELGMDPDSRSDCSELYNSVIKYWRDKGIEQFKKWDSLGIIPKDRDRYTRWDIFLYNYNQNDAYIFLFDNENKYYVQPGFDELERMDKKRLQRQWKGIGTVIEEMIAYDNRLLIDGSQMPITELLNAGKEVDALLDHHKGSGLNES